MGWPRLSLASEFDGDQIQAIARVGCIDGSDGSVFGAKWKVVKFCITGKKVHTVAGENLRGVPHHVIEWYRLPGVEG